jgi:hypothetical protein
VRHNPNRNRPEFKAPLRVRVYAALILAMAPLAAALWRWPAGAALMALALAFARWPAILAALPKKRSRSDGAISDPTAAAASARSRTS